MEGFSGIEVLVYLADHEPRSSPYFLIDSADVLADNAEAQDGDADEKIQNRKQREHALGFRSDNNAADEKVDDEEEAPRGDQQAEQGKNLEGHDGEPCHEVEIEPYQVVEPVLGFTGRARRVLDLHFGRIDGKAVGERGDECGCLAACRDALDDILPVGAEHAALVPHADARDLRADAVDDLRGAGAEERVPSVFPVTP